MENNFIFGTEKKCSFDIFGDYSIDQYLFTCDYCNILYICEHCINNCHSKCASLHSKKNKRKSNINNKSTNRNSIGKSQRVNSNNNKSHSQSKFNQPDSFIQKKNIYGNKSSSPKRKEDEFILKNNNINHALDNSNNLISSRRVTQKSPTITNSLKNLR